MSRGTTIRSVRVPDELWDAALACAADAGTTVAEVVRDALAEYVHTHRTGTFTSP